MEPPIPAAVGSAIASATVVELKNTAIKMQKLKKDHATVVKTTKNVETDDADPTDVVASSIDTAAAAADPTDTAATAAIFNSTTEENGLSVTEEMNNTERQVSSHDDLLLSHI